MPGRTALLATIGILAVIAVGVRVVSGDAEQPSRLAGSTTEGVPAVAAKASTAPSPTYADAAGAPAAGASVPGTSAASRSTAQASSQASSQPASEPAAQPSSQPSSQSVPPAPDPGGSVPAVPSGGLPTGTPTPLPAPSLDFVLSSLNVLGASHTTASGKRPGMASGRVRAVRAAELIRRNGADVVGFQELQTSQLTTLQRKTDLDFYPGLSLRAQDSENSIGWRRDRWAPVELRTVRIPYFDGSPRAMPYVRLRSLSSGLDVWFGNFHNPADTATYHHQQRYRTRATAIEIALANRLRRTGFPVFFTGDMNERASFFCRFTRETAMVAARGGSHRGGCLPGRPRAVDWVFGSPGVDFTGYYEDRSHLVDITTDHPMVVARAHLEGTPPAD
jgi:Endonuclease/Exonuclease/phosphatase family